jgi:hypothetical protein
LHALGAATAGTPAENSKSLIKAKKSIKQKLATVI